jgi:hypothetical protein
MDINKQIEELKVYFDTDLINNYSKLDCLTLSEFTNIKLKIKREKTDGVYPISDRIYLQMMNAEVFIFDF